MKKQQVIEILQAHVKDDVIPFAKHIADGHLDGLAFTFTFFAKEMLSLKYPVEDLHGLVEAAHFAHTNASKEG